MLAAASLLCACSGGGPRSQLERSVYLTQPEQTSQKIVKSYSGIVKEANEISLGFKTAGQIEKIYVEEGEFVHRGELLAELDDDDYQLAVDALQIQYNQLQDEVDRTRQLFEQRSVSPNDFEKATAGLEQLAIQLQANQNKVNYTKLYAPTDGYIQRVNFSPAEMVDAGTALFTLLDLSRMEIDVDIPRDLYRQQERFLGFRCKAEGIAESMPLTLSGLTPKADGNQLYRMRLNFEGQPDPQLTAGMNVEVEISLSNPKATDAVTIPLGAIFQDGDSACVWLFQPDSTVVKRSIVQGGLDPNGRAIVLEGLTSDDRIVRAGASTLQPGEKVHVIGTPDKTNVGGVL